MRVRSGWTAALILREKPGVPKGPGLLSCAPRITVTQPTSPPAHWPADQERPSPSLLYQWLNRAFEEKLVRRQGAGRRDDPYRYRLPNEDDEYLDCGEMPPIRERPRSFAH
jgi:hypothetical protein